MDNPNYYKSLVMAAATLALGSLTYITWPNSQVLRSPEVCSEVYRLNPAKCCETTKLNAKNTSERYQVFKVCFTSNEDIYNCKLDTCIAKKFGYMDSKGNINKSQMVERFDIMDGYPNMKNQIINECILSDVGKNKNFGKPNECELIRIRHCAQLHILLSCTPTSDPASECDEMKQKARECLPSKPRRRRRG